MRNSCRCLIKERDHFVDVSLDGRIILIWISDKQGLMVWTGFTPFRIGSCGGAIEHPDIIYTLYNF
jgi:hypothetical protein